MSQDKNKPVGAKRAIASGAATGKRGRFSAPRKAQAVLRLLRGEDLELLSRELGVVASTLSLWREQFLAAGQSSLKGKTGKADERDEQIREFDRRLSQLGEEHSHALQTLRERDAELAWIKQRLEAVSKIPGVGYLIRRMRKHAQG